VGWGVWATREGIRGEVTARKRRVQRNVAFDMGCKLKKIQTGAKKNEDSECSGIKRSSEVLIQS